MLSQWGQDPLQGNPRYTSIRTLNHNGRTFEQLAVDRSTGDKVAIKFTQRGEALTVPCVGLQVVLWVKWWAGMSQGLWQRLVESLKDYLLRPSAVKQGRSSRPLQRLCGRDCLVLVGRWFIGEVL